MVKITSREEIDSLMMAFNLSQLGANDQCLLFCRIRKLMQNLHCLPRKKGLVATRGKALGRRAYAMKLSWDKTESGRKLAFCYIIDGVADLSRFSCFQVALSWLLKRDRSMIKQ